MQSAAGPAVIITLIGIPCASTARCSFVLSPLLSAHVLVAAPCSCCVRVNFNVACIDHQPLKIRIDNQLFEERLPNPLVAPTTKASVCIFPITIIRGQIAPRRAGTKDPKYSIYQSLPPKGGSLINACKADERLKANTLKS